MSFNPTFCEIRQESKDVVYLVNYDKDSTVKLVDTYNSISQGYMGVQLIAFVETIRGLLRAYPDFLETQYIGHDPRRALKELGFTEIEPTKMQLLLYANKRID